MRIVHIHLLGPYTDGWGYQENILPEVQARKGHEVTVIANCRSHNSDNSIIEGEPNDYYLNGVRIIRISYRKIVPHDNLNRILFDYPVYSYLEKLSPDIILLHGLGSGITNFVIRKYVIKHPECSLFGDVHEFYGNTTRAITMKERIVCSFVKKCRSILFPYYKSVLCVSQQCLEYAKSEYNLSDDAVKLFPLGYDPEKIAWKNKPHIRSAFRKNYGISENELVIVHGGKIIPRRKTEMAIDIIKSLSIKTRVIVFGEIEDGMKTKIKQSFDKCENLIYLGHLSKEQYIEVFLSSDIALFPGAQSSIWEEAIGCGLPLFINHTEIKDAPYYDRGGNVAFSSEDSVQSFVDLLNEKIISGSYKEMAHVAETTGREFFSYDKISDSMIEDKT